MLVPAKTPSVFKTYEVLVFVKEGVHSMQAGVNELSIASKAEHNWLLSSECAVECLPSYELQPLLLHSMESIQLWFNQSDYCTTPLDRKLKHLNCLLN